MNESYNKEARLKWQEVRCKINKKALTDHLGLTDGTFSHWKAVPRVHLKQVIAFLQVSEQELRPDLTNI